MQIGNFYGGVLCSFQTGKTQHLGSVVEKRRGKQAFWLGLLLGILLVGVCGVSYAQTTGTISGTVVDQSGAAVPNAKIIARNEGTGVAREVVTSPDGNFVFAVMPVGTYEITANAAGFATTVLKNVQLNLNQNLRLDIHLDVGSMEQRVEVTVGAQQVELQSTALGEVEYQETIQGLPLVGRNFLQLAQLDPGVNPNVPGSATLATPSTPGGVSFSPQANGLRPYENLVLIDGIYDIEPSLNTVMSVPNPETLEEFKIFTGNYAAEFGGAGGVVVNVITRSGKNELHGSAYLFERNDALDARDAFAPFTEPRKQHQFGFTLGGAIRKDKTFFFGAYEGTRDRREIVTTAGVMSDRERLGDFSSSANPPIDPATGLPFPGNIIPPSRFHPISRRILNAGLFAPENFAPFTWAGALDAPTRIDQFTVRIDHHFSSNDILSGRFYFEDINIRQPIQPYGIAGTISTPGFAVRDTARFQTYQVSETHFFSPNVSNEFKIAFVRAGLGFNVPVDRVNARDFGFTFPVSIDFPFFPQIGIAGFNSIGLNDSAITLRATNMLHIRDDIGYVRGRHVMKFGAEVRPTQLNSFSPIGAAGTFLFTGLITGNPTADFVLGIPFLTFAAGGEADRYFRSTYFAAYFQDAYRLTNNLTLDFGLRYDLFTPPTEKRDRMATLVPGQQSIVHPDVPRGVVFPGDPGIPRGIFPLDKNNFSPRFGLAWDPTGRGRTSVRAAYGLFYSLPILYSNIDGTVMPKFWPIGTTVLTPFDDPFSGNSPFAPGAGPIPGTLPPPFTGQNLAGWMPRVTTPYVQHWNLTIQQQLATDYLLQLSYVGTAGHHLVGFASPTQLFINLPGIPNDPTTIPQRQRIPGMNLSGNSDTRFNSNYHGFQVSVTKRYSQGISFSAAYTFSKTIDDASAANRFQVIPGAALYPQDSTNLRAERALSNFDIRNRFTTNFTWDIPWAQNLAGTAEKVLDGWKLNGIITLQSGRPFTVIDPTDPQVVLEFFSRPDQICDPNLPPSQRTARRWFNTACFQRIPPFLTPTRFGNAPRNSVEGPGLANVDFSVVKITPIGERVKTEFRVEFFNLFNRVNLGVPVNDISSPRFGEIVSTAGGPRRIQLAFKLSF